MCPGLTSPGASTPDHNIPIGDAVAIYAEGMDHACAIGILTMSLNEIKSVNKGHGVEVIHCKPSSFFVE